MELINQGEFARAARIIQEKLQHQKALSEKERKQMQFELERMERIKKDFSKKESDVLAFIRRYIPEVSQADLNRWERERSLEWMMIDGEKRYFNHAARNLFRIDKECSRIWNQAHYQNPEGPPPSRAKIELDQHNQRIMAAVVKSGEKYVQPARFRITYVLTVDTGAVPAGEIVRCWIPFPREIPGRQVDIVLLHTEPAQYRLADNTRLQRTIYLEQPASKKEPTRFSVEYEFTNHGTYTPIDPDKVKPAGQNPGVQPFLQERPPHIVFTPELKKLSTAIVGNETNPYRVAQRLYEWIDAHIPWASAREYSTIRNIPEYCLQNRHGDCGIKALLFITLCRMNGIPARWQSGWEFQPPDHDSMHDWGMIYLEPYGWVPVDVDYGLRHTDDELFKWFYLGGMDSYRLIFNDDFSRPFWPAKEHFRSETVDSQRGEVEWSGGNLYFDQWSWEMKWQRLQ